MSEAGIDSVTLKKLCKGIKESVSLEYLDLKHNIFDEDGLHALFEALKVNMTVKTLFLAGLRIGSKEV